VKKVTISNEKHTIGVTNIIIGELSGHLPERAKNAHWCYDAYLAHGGNCFDTARIYGGGHSEYALGEYLIGKPRDSYVISTKCGHHNCEKPPIGRLSAKEINDDVEESLRALNCEYIDILYLHRDDIYKDVSEIMPTLHKFVVDGKVRVLGASNWTAARIAEANIFAAENDITPFSVSQIHWNLGLTTAARTGDLTHIVMNETEMNWYTANQFPVMAYTPTGRGFFAKTITNSPMNPSALKYFGWLPENHARAKRAEKLANELGVSVSAIVLSYVLSAPIPAMGITAFSAEQQFHETMQAASLVLTAEQCAFLEGEIVK